MSRHLLFKMVRCSKWTANLYLPTEQKVKGGVLLLHGSEGGGLAFHDSQAQMLAVHGFAALAFSWCGSPLSAVQGLPSQVIDIDLGRTMQAFRWLKARPEMRGKRAALYGFSRGAEQALILAVLSARHADVPKPDMVAVRAASDTYVGGYSWSWDAPGGKPDLAARAWLWQGRVVGGVGKRIPIERFDGPILLTHGEQDKLWSAARSRRLAARLKAAGRSVETLFLPEEEHVLTPAGAYREQSKLVAFLNRYM